MNGASFFERFGNRVSPEPNSGCWLWLGEINQFGYGRMHFAHKKQSAHRVAFEYETGTSIPAGMQLDHLCRVRSCVNPEHLEIVTQTENVRRSLPFKSGTAALLNNGLCIHGHPYTGDHRFVRKDGSVRCLTCVRIEKRRWWASPKGRASQRRRIERDREKRKLIQSQHSAA